MPIRPSRPWLGATPHRGMPRSASGRMGMYIPILPSAAGSLPANSPSRKGVERRFDAAEDVLADRLAARLSGLAGQDRDAPVPARRLAFPHGIDGPGATPGEVGMAVHIPTVAVPYQAPRRVGRSRQRPQAPARHGRYGALAANAMKSATCGIGGVSHPSVITVHNDPNVTCALWIGNGPRPRAVKSRARGSGSNATPNGRRSSLPEPWIGAYPPSRPSGGDRLGSRPFPRPPRRPCRRSHSRCA